MSSKHSLLINPKTLETYVSHETLLTPAQHNNQKDWFFAYLLHPTTRIRR